MVAYFISNVDVCVVITQDVYPILKAVHEAAIDGGPLWKSLVRAGIADGLCQTFIDLKVPRDYSIDEVLPPILLDSCLTLTSLFSTAGSIILFHAPRCSLPDHSKLE